MQSNDEVYHIPVLLTQVLQYLKPSNSKRFIDATLGGGCHTKALAEEGAEVLGIDIDPDAIAEAEKWRAAYPLVHVVEAPFTRLKEIASEKGFTNVDGTLLDLGVSSHQLQQAERGFSFQHDAPLDMRMSPKLGVTAADLLQALSEKELVRIFEEYGQERQSRRIAKAIVQKRKHKPIITTGELVNIITATVGEKSGKIHSATRVFQALRIVTNSELENLHEVLPQALAVLKPNGRIAVISFHSLEDRIVKQTMRTWEEHGLGTAVTKKPIEASEEETSKNPKARSAKLRVFEKA